MRTEAPARNVAYDPAILEESKPFASDCVIDLGGTFAEQHASSFACPPQTREVKNFLFDDVSFDTASGVVFKGEHAIPETRYLIWEADYERAQIRPAKLVKLPENQHYVLGFNNGYQNYYHWMIQAIPSMDLSIRALSHGSSAILALPPLSGWQERSLQLLGLSKLPRLTLDRNLQYRFASASYSEFLNGSVAFDVSLTALGTFRRLREAVHRTATAHDCIYVARTDSEQRVALNEPGLIRLLEEMGFGIVVPGTLSIDEQINAFRAARLVIGTHGAGMSNIAFCDPGTVVYELLPQYYANPCINKLAQAAKLHYMADLFPGDSEGWVHSRTWTLDLERIAVRAGQARALADRVTGQRPAPSEATRSAKLIVESSASRRQEEHPDGDRWMPLGRLMLNFESLGDNCEFGLVQRQVGAEPLGLLRCASPFVPVEIRLETVASALKGRFAKLGEPETVCLELAGRSAPREYMIRESAYQLLYHTFKHEGEIDPDDFQAREAKRLRFLRDKLLRDLAAGEKICVWKSNLPLSDERVAHLLSVLRDFGPNTLLWMCTADTHHRAGLVERLDNHLLKGYISKFAPYDNAGAIQFGEWYMICRNAYALWKGWEPSAPRAQPRRVQSPRFGLFYSPAPFSAKARPRLSYSERADGV